MVAFDLLAQLYAEERRLAETDRVPRDWAVPEHEAARTILERNLHGIDIDPRAVQIAALALYLKATDQGLTPNDKPPRLNLVIADAVLTRGPAYEGLLGQYKQDPAAVEAIQAIWHSLEHVRDLGSLVRVEEEVEQAVRSAQSAADRKTPLFSSATDWEAYKRTLRDRLKCAFAAEAGSDDLSERIFGAEGAKGVGLLGLLARRYDVVCTNPPYLGSRNMGPVCRDFLETSYPEGKRDLYASFILRCHQLAVPEGHVAMVTQHGWMFLESFSELRTRLLTEGTLSTLAHLGPRTFKELSNTNALGFVLFVVRRSPAHESALTICLRMVHEETKERPLLDAIQASNLGLREARRGVFTPSRRLFLSTPKSVLSYWIPPGVTEAFLASHTMADYVEARQGLATADNNRFLRFWWEVPLDTLCVGCQSRQEAKSTSARWFPYMKGGPFRRWYGNQEYVINWYRDGEEIRAFDRSVIRNPSYYYRPGGTWTAQSSYGFSARLMPAGFIFDSKGPAFFIKDPGGLDITSIIALANSSVIQFVFAAIQPTVDYHEGYFMSLPVPADNAGLRKLVPAAEEAIGLKKKLVDTQPTELSFKAVGLESYRKDSLFSRWSATDHDENVSIARLATVEGQLERIVFNLYQLSPGDVQIILDEIGTSPALWPVRYGCGLSACEHEVGSPADESGTDPIGRRSLKELLGRLYSFGPGAGEGETQELIQDLGTDGSDSAATEEAGSRVSAPRETFIDELSQRVMAHPSTVCCLLEELRQENEGLSCPPELVRRVEDFFSVTLLRMLGHRWPMQDDYEREQSNSFINEKWVDTDGIIPLTPGAGEETLMERLHRLLDEEFGPAHGPSVETEAGQILGWKPGDEWGQQKATTLARWFEREFFKRHVSQFKRRPIAWHLSSAKGTFQAIVYYHRFDKNRLTLLRARHVREVLESLRKQLAESRAFGQDRNALAKAADLEARLADVQDFDDRLRRLLEGREREARIWCPWKKPEEQPIGWDPDINDGVRVNIAPVQRLGLLAADVLAAKDLKSSIAPEGRA